MTKKINGTCPTAAILRAQQLSTDTRIGNIATTVVMPDIHVPFIKPRFAVVTLDGRRDVRAIEMLGMIEIGELSMRDFETIANSFNGIRARVENEIELLAAREINVAAYRDALMAAVTETQPIAGEMVDKLYQPVDAKVANVIDEAFRKLHEVEMAIRSANWFLDRIIEENARFTLASTFEPCKLEPSEEKKAQGSAIFTGFIKLAADHSAEKQKSKAALDSITGHVEAMKMAEAQKALDEGRSFGGRIHMMRKLIERGALVKVTD